MRHSRSPASVAALAALTGVAAASLAACGSEEDQVSAAPRDVVMEMRPVALSGPTADGSQPLLKEPSEIDDMLADLGLESARSAWDAVAWFSVGDCAATPVASSDVAAACSSDGSQVFLLGAVAVDDGHVVHAEQSDGGDTGTSVNLTFDEEGAQALAALTESLAVTSPPSQIAVLIDGEVVSAPTVMNAISDGRVSIVGGEDDEDLARLAEALG